MLNQTSTKRRKREKTVAEIEQAFPFYMVKSFKASPRGLRLAFEL